MPAGGTGETFLYKDKVTGELVAVKLIRRPLPKVIQANILREIMVRSAACLNYLAARQELWGRSFS